MCEMQDTKWLFAISVLMLVTVLAFTTLNGLVPYGSPAEVIKTFYSACNNGNYSVAERLLVPEANRVLTRHIGAVDGGLRGICDEETKQGPSSKSRGSPPGSPWRSSTGSLHALLCGRQYNRRKSGASLETLGLEDRTIEGGVAENHKAFAYGLATLKPVLVCHICQWSIRPKRALSITGLRSHGT